MIVIQNKLIKIYKVKYLIIKCFTEFPIDYVIIGLIKYVAIVFYYIKCELVLIIFFI
jgi:hypothetical protein